MADRYGDRYDSYYDHYDDRRNGHYGSARDGQSGYRSSSSSSSYPSYSDSYSDYPSYSSYPRYSDYPSYPSYSSSASSRRSAGNDSSSRASQGSDARYGSTSRGSQGSDARYGSSRNVFSDYYPEDTDIDMYRRSSYTSSSSRGTTRSGSSYDYRTASRLDGRTSRRTSYTSPTLRASSLSSEQSDRYQQTDLSDERSSYRTSAYEPSSEPRRSSSYGRDSYSDEAPRDFDASPKRSNRKRNLIIAAVVALVVVLVGAGMAFAYVNSISNNLHEGVDDDLRNALVETDMANEAFYMLLLGTDASEWRTANQADMADTMRSDSMMLARIDPVNKKVSLISIDRDTMVDLGKYGTQKINAAYTIGGAAMTVEAVSKMTGLDISHYASVDFDGFAAIVDSLGGVEVDVPIAVDDPEAGGSVEAGLQTLNGDQALILCRARHAYDDLTSGGVIRDGYQRIVLSAIAKKILSSDIPTIAKTVQDVSKYVTTDLELSDIIGLAQILQGLDPATDIYTAHEPTQSLYIDETWYELLDEDEWAKMISRMEKGLSPSEEVEIDEATGVVLSTNGDASAAANATGYAQGQRATSTHEGDDD